MKYSRYLFFSLLFFFFILKSFPAYAAISYPITELNNCKNQSDCFAFCEKPTNHAACTAYAAKMQRNEVLGETTMTPETSTDFTYPIATLGNCSSRQNCFTYCQNTSYRAACISYAKAHNMPYQKDYTDAQSKIMKDLGCPDKTVCRAVCERPENRGKCTELGKKYSIN